MFDVLKQWYNRYLTDPEVVILLFGLLLFFVVFKFFGAMLAPVFSAIVIAYLLDGPVEQLTRFKIPHALAVSITFIIFIGAVAISLFGLLPLLWQQATNLIQELPNMIAKGQTILMHLPERYPDFVSQQSLDSVLALSKSEIGRLGQVILSLSLASLPNIISLIVYLVLLPLLVFFFLIDKTLLVTWFRHYIPKEKRLLESVWAEVNAQLGK